MNAYKGFDENFKCNDGIFDSTVNKHYTFLQDGHKISDNEHDDDFITGYRAYTNIVDLISKYPNNGQNKYALVKCYGRNYGNISTIITWHLQIIRFITWDELLNSNKNMITCYNGDKVWYYNGQIHRNEDLPAIICANGDKMWYRYGKLHRDNELPAIVYYKGNMKWYNDGKRYYPNNLQLDDGLINESHNNIYLCVLLLLVIYFWTANCL